MKIGIIGCKGLVGRAIYERLEKNHFITGIHRHNYLRFKGAEFDILINANGNSRKYWANENPLEDFDASVSTVMGSLFDFTYKKYIFISSIDAEEPRGHYGFNKRIAEDLVKQYADKWQIVRLCSVIGEYMNKGPVYDILHGNPIYLTSGSTLQLITAEEVAELLSLWLGAPSSGMFALYSQPNMTIREIGEVLQKPLNIDPYAREEKYGFMPKFPIRFKSSYNYLMQIT